MKSSIYYRRSRPGGSAGFSLFPFLAVLICTMGVLILLLVVISRNIRDKAVAAESSIQTPILDPTLIGLHKTATDDEITEKLVAETETYEWLTQEILLSKEETVEQLNDARARVGAIETSIKRLLEEAERLHEAMKSLVENNVDPSEDLAKLQKLLDEKLKIKEQAEAELKELREKQENLPRSYAIVPYRGPNGTFRRPIYIECRADVVVIQPEGIILQADDFLTPDHRDNPMEMGVRTVRQYLVETQQLQRDTEPYPLFLVRPSGIYAYEAALRSLGSWKGDFGYELVEEDWNLEYPKPSEELKQRLDRQIQIARTRQFGYIQSEIARGALGGGVKRQYRASSQGGFEQTGVVSGGGGIPTNTFTQTGDPLLAGTLSPPGTPSPNGTMSPLGEVSPSGTMSPSGTSENKESSNPPQNNPNLPVGMSATSGEPTTQPSPLVPSLTFEQVTRGPQKEGRQKNWGLKNVRQSAKPVTRIVQIKCDTDRYTIVKQSGVYRHRDIPLSGQFSENASDRLVKSIWDFMETWDSAGENHFWRPMLRVQVLPGADAVFEQLKSDLADSGLGVERI